MVIHPLHANNHALDGDQASLDLGVASLLRWEGAFPFEQNNINKYVYKTKAGQATGKKR